jgi:hypothetical protein
MYMNRPIFKYSNSIYKLSDWNIHAIPIHIFEIMIFRSETPNFPCVPVVFRIVRLRKFLQMIVLQLLNSLQIIFYCIKF